MRKEKSKMWLLISGRIFKDSKEGTLDKDRLEKLLTLLGRVS